MLAHLMLCTLTLVGADAQPPAKAKKPDLFPVEANIIHFTNLQRAKFGLPTYEVDPELMESARRHALWMAKSHNMVHSSQPVAENIAMGQASSNEAVRSWMNSSGHRANILNRGHRKIGVAGFRTAEGTIFWCQQFRR